ncbi:MAG: YtfJ family protein [Arsenophonus sp. NC-CH8-MAG3]
MTLYRYWNIKELVGKIRTILYIAGYFSAKELNEPLIEVIR